MKERERDRSLVTNLFSFFFLAEKVFCWNEKINHAHFMRMMEQNEVGGGEPNTPLGLLLFCCWWILVSRRVHLDVIIVTNSAQKKKENKSGSNIFNIPTWKEIKEGTKTWLTWKKIKSGIKQLINLTGFSWLVSPHLLLLPSVVILKSFLSGKREPSKLCPVTKETVETIRL